MPPWAADALLNLILISPFIGAAIVVFRMARAFHGGEVLAGKGSRRNLSKVSAPGQFWFEMALHLVVAVFLFLIGLSFTDYSPQWLEAWMRSP